MIIGQDAHRYRWIEDWMRIPETATSHESGRTHGVAVTRDGHIAIFHEADPAVLILDADGRLLTSWGRYPEAHGMTLVEHDGVECLWLTDKGTGEVARHTLDGRIVQAIEKPPHPAYARQAYSPTWVAVNEERHGGNGDIWVTDGYGASLVHRHDSAGNYLGTLDGTEGAGRFDCPHGIAFDFRGPEPELLVADRVPHRIQVFDAGGRFKRCFGEEFLIRPCGFAFHGELLIVPEIWGRVTILDRDNRLVCHLGENPGAREIEGWPNLAREHVHPGKFITPHDAAVDAAGNIYVVEFKTGGRVIKLERQSG